ncbi:Nif3-like dinuclear metal center hexameric protein [Flammeovirga kamogawensis]|uniref:GTP cyclohydrolase 1 type 2 homolog n=1 Tax=Flammeovirga kamogawensis TaxID=373891 RepID=A0ABX8GWN5_9BACT|nr:Nif3-like dinuclear metal center hexameric protein [Flammeovirga kamogawensis]MBB6460655.1 dinuclear metal center YbgI/SA1388 family protein [Flammeovirga kamogawensis]QWG08010.1 Nif3-like dinuclear metal center hexameric protein [Flammeovirga kamogawensis]TRX69817.1 Nif3-like dinuclear metal center hexameric protein [Flammeovirga kamogawensis]
MKVKDIINKLDALAPSMYQEGYDNAGLITGSGNDIVTKVLVSLDCTEEIVQEAIEKGCNLIVAHHPIVFKGLKRLNGKNYVERTIIKAIKNDISIFAIHTNLDNMQHGVNAKICDLIGLTNQRILAPTQANLFKLVTYVPINDIEKVETALHLTGAGKIGNYEGCNFKSEGTGSYTPNINSNPTIGEHGKREYTPEIKLEVQFQKHLKGKIINALLNSHPYEEIAYQITALENTNNEIGSGMYGTLAVPEEEIDFLKRIKQTFGVGVIRHTPLLNKKIKKVAVCGGSGSFLLRNARSINADIFITGDFKYHEFFDAEGKIVIADIGHYESEQFTSDLLKDYIESQFDKVICLKTTINTNPINYFV